jgi:hypothetical protein
MNRNIFHNKKRNGSKIDGSILFESVKSRYNDFYIEYNRKYKKYNRIWMEKITTENEKFYNRIWKKKVTEIEKNYDRKHF